MKTASFVGAGNQQTSETRWEIIGVVPDQATCEYRKKFIGENSQWLKDSGKKHYQFDGAWSQTFRSLVCLPETIDPRDNKASPLPTISKEREDEKPKPLYIAQSTITETEGNACMGNGKSRKQTEQAALLDAKQKAVEYVSTHIKSETQVKNFEIKKDLLSAYANAEVKMVQEQGKSWYNDTSSRECYKIKIKAEVIPDENKIRDYELQERCGKTAAQSAKEEHSEPYIGNQKTIHMCDYQNHYNKQLNKCLLLIQCSEAPLIFNYDQVTLWDVNQNTVFGLILNNAGDIGRRECKNKQDCDALVKKTMEE